MRIDQIMMKPFEFRSVIDFESRIQVNEHGYARVTGYVTQEQKDRALALMTRDVWAKILFHDEEGNDNILFCGLAVNVRIEEGNSLYVMTVELKTGTFLMDLKEHIRVFQNGKMSYNNLQRAFLKYYIAGRCLMRQADGFIGGMLVQYRETDWEFAKRLASRRNTVIVPNEKNVGVKYSFGVTEEDVVPLVSFDGFWMVKDLGSYQVKRENGVRNMEENDELSYMVDSREVFYLGDCVSFQDRNYIVAEISRTWKNREVWSRYVLKSVKGIRQVTYHNKKIIGASLQGAVTDISRDTVKITVNQDENGNQGGQKWFAYSTVFSSPDGTGWYCMPEKGDSVQLYFPNEDESFAYVSSSVNLSATDSEARSNPNHKSIKNMQGKEILFMPDKLIITNNKGMSITIDDNTGIIMQSDKDIVMEAKESIGLISQEQTLQMLAKSQVLLKQGETSIDLTDNVVMRGGQVNIQ